MFSDTNRDKNNADYKRIFPGDTCETHIFYRRSLANVVIERAPEGTIPRVNSFYKNEIRDGFQYFSRE